MRYDDRLATVLRLNVTGQTVARIQYNQLIDLLGTCPAEARGDVLDQAYVRLADLSARIPATDRANALAQPGLRLRSPRLVAALASAERPVAVAAIRAAVLSEEQWLDLIPALPPAARGTLRARTDFGGRTRALLARLGIGDHALAGTGPADELALEESQNVVPLHPQPVEVPAEPASGIGAIVERIEAFRRARDANGTPAAAGELPQLPLGDAPATPPPLTAIDFTTDNAGRIAWSERTAAPMLVGLNLAAMDGLRAAMRQRLPLRAATIALRGAPAVAGDWQVDAAPRFDSHGGRFTGYIGRLRRVAEVPVPGTESPLQREADALRQVLHDLRTPISGIQGYAEIIQHQLYGTTPHEYRALSAVIVADAARILSGFEELERLAGLATGTLPLAEGECDFAEVARTAAQRLAPQAQAHGFAVTLAGSDAALPVALAPIDAERLCWRLLGTLTSAAQAGDVLACALDAGAGTLTLALTLPARLAALDDQALFSGENALPATSETGTPGGMFGPGFALRLARAEARAAGGTLFRDKEKLNLVLPLLTRVAAIHTDGDTRGHDRKAPPASA